VIIPILLQREEDESLQLVSQKSGKTMPELVKTCYPRIIACLVPCFAADSSDGLKDVEVRIAKRLHVKLEQILSKDTITCLLNHHLSRVIVNIMRLLFDPQHFGELCGVSREMLSDPDPPYFNVSTILKSLLYLQVSETSTVPDFYVTKSILQSLHIEKLIVILLIKKFPSFVKCECFTTFPHLHLSLPFGH
jgi:hypothetical protein